MLTQWGFQNYQYSWLFTFVLVVVLFVFIFLERKKRHMQLWSNDCIRISSIESVSVWLFRHLLLVLALSFLVFSMMNPIQKKLEVVPQTQSIQSAQPHRINFILDTSLSMSVVDMENTQSRFAIGKKIIQDVTQRLDDQYVRLIGFNKYSEVAIPQTQDRFFFNIMVNEINFEDLPTQGTDLLQMLDFVNDHIYKDDFLQQETIILLTDGADLFLEDKNEQERVEALQIQIDQMNEQSLAPQVIIVGIGSSSGGPIPNASFQGKPVVVSIDDAILQSLAITWGGQYYKSIEYQGESLANIISESILKSTPSEKVMNQVHERTNRHYHFFMTVCALLCLFIEGVNKLSLGRRRV